MSKIDSKDRPVAMAFPRLFSLPHPVLAGGFLAGYVLLDWLSFIQPFAPFGITPWNPPTGLSFVLVLLFGHRFIPLLFVAPFLADLLVRHLPFPWSIEIATNVIIGGAYSLGLMVLTHPATRFNSSLPSLRDLIIFFAVAIVSAATAAILYVGLLVWTGWVAPQDFATASLQFWIGDIIGIAVVAPFALIFLTRRRAVRITGETVAQLLCIAAALAFVVLLNEGSRFEFFYILFLPIIWMAVRGGLPLVAIGIAITQLGLILITQFLPHEGINVAGFQALMLVLAITGLAAGVAVTEHRRTEFQLRLHQESLARISRVGSMGEFAAMIAHEINQPLMAAGTYARLIADTLRAGEKHDVRAVETAEKTAKQIQRAADVLRQLRALIRLDRSSRAPIGLPFIIRETLDLCGPDLERHGVAVRLELASQLPPLMVDLLQIEQVFVNLLRNAAEAIAETDPAGTIVVRARATEAGQVDIEVSDSGPGFPEPFTELETVTLSKKKTDSLGIGLSLCRSIIEAHGGQLTIVGGIGRGVVRFTLPMAREA
jgi:signal transduction histidine kinase